MRLDQLTEKDVTICDDSCAGHFIADGCVGDEGFEFPVNVHIGPVVLGAIDGPDEQPELWAVWEQDAQAPFLPMREEFAVFEFEAEAREEAKKRVTRDGAFDPDDQYEEPCEPWDEV